jgi:ribonuclease J
MMRDIERLPTGTASTLLYSLWPGYLDRDDGQLQSWCQARGIAFEIAHTSGHADPDTLVRFAKALHARMIVPIHTAAPLAMRSLLPNVRVAPDGYWLPL